jgi:hypothetical protein
MNHITEGMAAICKVEYLGEVTYFIALPDGGYYPLSKSPYIPEPVCPECGHKVSEHDYSGCNVGYGMDDMRRNCRCELTPSNLQPKEDDYVCIVGREDRRFCTQKPCWKCPNGQRNPQPKECASIQECAGKSNIELCFKERCPWYKPQPSQKHCTQTRPCFLHDVASESVCCWCPNWQPVEPEKRYIVSSKAMSFKSAKEKATQWSKEYGSDFFVGEVIAWSGYRKAVQEKIEWHEEQ